MVAAPFICRRIIANRHNPRAGNRQRAWPAAKHHSRDEILPLCKIISAVGRAAVAALCGREQKEKRGSGKQTDETDH